MERTNPRGLAGWLRSVAPERRTLKSDAMAGLPTAIGCVPDGMAGSVLVGVNPIHGLYANFAGPVAGGLSASTKLMVITTTSASALAAGSALEKVSSEDRPGALFLLTIIAGAAMVARRAASPGPVHPVREPFGDDRLSQRDLRQHHRRPGARPDRSPGRGIGRRSRRRGTS